MSTSDERQVVHEQRLRDEFHRRLMYLKALKDVSQAEIADGVWGSASTVSDWFNAEKKAIPEGIKLLRLAELFPDVNFHWLITGLGDPEVLPTNGEQYASGAQEVITRAQLFLEDVKSRLAERRARTTGAIAVADVRREIGRADGHTPPKRGARNS